MQCACPDCGRLMGKVEKGLDSYCQCPECLRKCRDCLGSTKGFPAFISHDEIGTESARLRIQKYMSQYLKKNNG